MRAETLTLDARDAATGEPRRVEVHAKRLDALGWIARFDYGISALLVLQDARRGRGSGEAMDPDTLAEGIRHWDPARFGTAPIDPEAAIEAYHRLIIWILTTPGLDLPGPMHPTPEPPAWTAELSPRDVLEIVRTGRRVNAAGFHLLTPEGASFWPVEPTWRQPAPTTR
ncbi:MAG: hypothetical protein AB7R55_13030 [Gemmatimonadales bacterium]